MFTIPGIRVHDALEWMFTFGWNLRSRCPGIRSVAAPIIGNPLRPAPVGAGARFEIDDHDPAARAKAAGEAFGHRGIVDEMMINAAQQDRVTAGRGVARMPLPIPRRR